MAENQVINMDGEEMEKVSIIIPVYNCVKYLPSCLKSVLKQTYQNIEIILIDDGSVDGSGELCDRYAVESERIKVHHQKNMGPGAARNAGLDIMTGDCLTYIDADDYVAEDYVETLLGLLKKYDADISEVGLVCLEATHNVFECSDGKSECFEGPELLIQDYFSPDSRVRNCIAGRMYRMDRFKDVRFSEKFIGEDSEYSLKMLKRCRRLVKYHKCLYACRAYHTSLTRNQLNHRHFDITEVQLRDACFADVSGVKLNTWDYVCQKFSETCYRLLADAAVQKKEGEFEIEFQNMLSVCKKMDSLAQKYGYEIPEQLFKDITGFHQWAEEYRKKNRVKLWIKRIRKCISGSMGTVKVKMQYEYKF